MEVMGKVARMILMAIASRGPEGVDMGELYSTLSPLLGRERISEELGRLIERGYVTTFVDGSKVRLIANRDLRKALANLEIQKQRIAAYLKRLKDVKAELEKGTDRRALEERLTLELYALVGSALINLLGDHEEVTVPEFVESLERLNQPLFSKLKLDLVGLEEITEDAVKAVETFLGKDEAAALSLILEAKRKVKLSINRQQKDISSRDAHEEEQAGHSEGVAGERQQGV